MPSWYASCTRRLTSRGIASMRILDVWSIARKSFNEQMPRNGYSLYNLCLCLSDVSKYSACDADIRSPVQNSSERRRPAGHLRRSRSRAASSLLECSNPLYLCVKSPVVHDCMRMSAEPASLWVLDFVSTAGSWSCTCMRLTESTAARMNQSSNRLKDVELGHVERTSSW